MIYVSWATVITVIVVLTLQFINLSKWWDGNGQMKTRVLFIVQVACIGFIAFCDVFRLPHLSAIPCLILAVDSLAFYLEWKWDVSTPLFWILKKIKK